MKIKFLLLLITLSNLVYGQPSLSSNEMAPFGTSWIMHYTQNFNLVDTTVQGANVTWNFSAVQPNSQTLTIDIVDPAQTPYASVYPSANYSYIEGPTLTYVYFNLSSSKMERIGSWRNGTHNSYSDPQVEYVYPLTLGSHNFDTWMNTLSSTGGTYELQCIGYGTLILPIGTFNDVLLVRVHVEEFILDLDVYFWYSSENGSVLVQYIPGDGFFVPQSLAYMTSFSTTVSNNSIFANFQYSNPVNNSLLMFFGENTLERYSYEIINIMGQEVFKGIIEKNVSFAEVDMTRLKSGIYLVNLKAEKSNNRKSVKIIKQ